MKKKLREAIVVAFWAACFFAFLNIFSVTVVGECSGQEGSSSSSLVAHASDSNHSETGDLFLSPSSSMSPPSASTTDPSVSSSYDIKKDEFLFMTDRELEMWTKEILRSIDDYLDLHDKRGRYALIPEKEIRETFHINGFRTKNEMADDVNKLILEIRIKKVKKPKEDDGMGGEATTRGEREEKWLVKLRSGEAEGKSNLEWRRGRKGESLKEENDGTTI